ncbi:UbiD family decarboxylase domain-containing protein [Dactylosporangium sp. CA-092794]|uniref:UbiD family decarboxylase domain-containing protein n=1 Tax=Dactylosporangium sp. CA-092794 TaxID=3239929 RepID=UPI003D947A89
MLDLEQFLDIHHDRHVHVRGAVELEQVGTLTAQSPESIVFHNLVGYPGWRLVDLLFHTRQAQARVLGCAADAVVPALVEVLRRGPRPLVEVDEAPCQRIVVEGADVDLGLLPIIRHTDTDPIACTTSFAVHRDPDTGRYNQMFPRHGVLGRAEMVSSFVTGTAIRYLSRHQARGDLMPQAIVIGAHPAWELAGTYTHPHRDWWEMQLFESITGQPGHVVRCKTVDLVVPADASVVIEGYVNPRRVATDGPSPGPTMLFTPHSAEAPVFEVTAITMRDRPIYRNHLMSPWTDHQELPRLFQEAILYERLQAMGLTVHDVHFPPAGGALSCVIQVDPQWEGQVTDALLATLGSSWINTKMVVAVDPDVDIYDPRDVHYAMATRVDPSRDVIIVPNARGWPFDPSARPILDAGPATAQTRFPSLIGKWGIDATKPPRYRAADRDRYGRAWPIGWGRLTLADFLDPPTPTHPERPS